LPHFNHYVILVANSPSAMITPFQPIWNVPTGGIAEDGNVTVRVFNFRRVAAVSDRRAHSAVRQLAHAQARPPRDRAGSGTRLRDLEGGSPRCHHRAVFSGGDRSGRARGSSL